MSVRVNFNEADSKAVVRRIIECIRHEGLGIGDKLPSIRQMARRWNLNPNVVRDGVLHAQTMGLVKIHPRSGAFVRSLDFSPMVDALIETMETALLQEDVNSLHLIEARRLVEVEAVGEAARRRQPEDLLDLRNALEEMRGKEEDRAAFIRADERFHLRIARIAGNPIYVAMVRSCLVLLRPYRMKYLPNAAGRATTDRLHEVIFQNIREGDVQGARSAMYEHLTEQRQRLVEEIDTSGEAGTARLRSS